jgi:hypothetical protein
MNSRKYITVTIGREFMVGQMLKTTILNQLCLQLPADAALVAVRIEYSRDRACFDFCSESFPEVELGVQGPEVIASVDGGNLKIEVPEGLKYIINDTFDPVSFAADPFWDEMLSASKASVQDTTACDKSSTFNYCKHEWYVTSRFSAIKHCKVCMTVTANDSSD